VVAPFSPAVEIKVATPDDPDDGVARLTELTVLSVERVVHLEVEIRL